MIDYTRRRFLKAGTAALGLASLVSLRAVGRRAIGDSPAAKLQFGLQLYTVDAEMHKDLPGTLRAVREIGYRDVEVVGWYGRSAQELRRALAAANLRCVSIHLRPQQVVGALPSLEQDPEWHLRACRELGVRYLVCPGPWLPERIMRDFGQQQATKQSVMEAVGRFEPADWRRSAELLNGLGQKAHAHGIQLLYHNGNFEFVTAGSAGTGYDVLLEATDPVLVQLEIDCGWVASAGKDPLSYLASQRGRVPLIHIKDMNLTAPNVAMQIESTEIGSGIVNWPVLLHAAQAAGVKYAFAEQEEPFVHPPLESSRMNLRYLSHLKL
ncbi:MAG: hypothetical protein RL684_53 [Pseudomonadota bacterium]